MPVKAMVLSHGYSSAILCIPRMVWSFDGGFPASLLCRCTVPFQDTCSRLCLLEIAGFRMETVISQQTNWLSTKIISYEAARRKCTSSSFSCWGRKRPSWRRGSQVGEVGSKSCQIPTFLLFFVDSTADVKFGHCETTWALWFWKEDMFISCATTWKCLGNESALNFKVLISLVRLHGVLANTFQQFQSYAW